MFFKGYGKSRSALHEHDTFDLVQQRLKREREINMGGKKGVLVHFKHTHPPHFNQHPVKEKACCHRATHTYVPQAPLSLIKYY